MFCFSTKFFNYEVPPPTLLKNNVQILLLKDVQINTEEDLLLNKIKIHISPTHSNEVGKF